MHPLDDLVTLASDVDGEYIAQYEKGAYSLQITFGSALINVNLSTPFTREPITSDVLAWRHLLQPFGGSGGACVRPMVNGAFLDFFTAQHDVYRPHLSNAILLMLVKPVTA